MNRHSAPIAQRILLAASVLVLFSSLGACAAPTPEERVMALRSDFEASLNSFQVHEQPLAPVEVSEGEMAASDDPARDAMATTELDDLAPQEPVAVRQDVLLDIVLRNRSDGRLPGVTLDIEQTDVAGEPKRSYRVYLDTATMGRGAERAVSHRLEDIDYVEGEGFHVEIRKSIPPEQRADYREFSEIADQP